MSNERWQPVVRNGEVVIMCECGDESCYKALVVSDHGDVLLEIHSDYSDKLEPDFKLFDLPDGYAVCKSVPDNRPRPDWSQAPDWAQWWAVDPDGYCHWFDNKPILDQVTSAPDIIRPHWSHVGRKGIRYEAVNIPLGIDWRTLIEQRPETDHAA